MIVLYHYHYVKKHMIINILVIILIMYLIIYILLIKMLKIQILGLFLGLVIHQAKVALTGGIALRGCQAKPLHGLGLILRHTLA